MNGPIHAYVYLMGVFAPKKHHLGPQNGSGSLGPKKLQKNYEDVEPF
jgi:hypothetical protein